MSELGRSAEPDIHGAEIWELAFDIDGLAHQPAEDRPATRHNFDEKIIVTDKNVGGKDIQYWLSWIEQEDGTGLHEWPLLGILYPDGTTNEYSMHPGGRIFHQDRDGGIARSTALDMFTRLQLMEGSMTSGRPEVKIAVADRNHQ
jgi:hypothetical protein